MSKSRAVGTQAETAVVRYLQNWWPAAERRALSGNKDRGDVAGMPGVVIEVKAAKKLELAAWRRETEVERVNAGATYGLLVVKRPYKPVERWDTYMPSAQLPGFLSDGMPSWVRADLCLAVALLRAEG